MDASRTSGGQRGNDKASRYRSRYQPTRKNLELAPRDSWESRSSYRISETLSCAATLRLTWSTHSVVDKANGACLSPDRERLRAGTCEWMGPMDSNARILSRLMPVSTSPRQSAHLF